MPTLMVSVSGIRGIVGDGLDPQTLIKYVSAYADFCNGGKFIVGRHARISGEMVYHIVVGSLLAKGVDVIDIGICPTPTVLFAVNKHKANGGIEISASHNPNEWNALKLVNDRGEFMTPEEHKEYIEIVNKGNDSFNRWDQLGKLSTDDEVLQNHINAVGSENLDLKVVLHGKGLSLLLEPFCLRDNLLCSLASFFSNSL